MKIKTLTKIVLVAVAMSVSYGGFAQKIRLNVYGHYVFNDNVESYYSSTNFFNGTLNGGFQWGGGLEFRINEGYGVELMYFRQDTKAPLQYYALTGVKNTTYDVAMNYLMIGGARALHVNEQVEPYGGIMLGAAFVDTKNPETGTKQSATKFAWGARLGANIWVTEAVGLKLQAQFIATVNAAGGSVYFGTGGSGTAVTAYSSVQQFCLGGGLVFRFGQ